MVSKKASERVPFCPPSIVGIRIEREIEGSQVHDCRPSTSQHAAYGMDASCPSVSLPHSSAGVMQRNVRSLSS